MRRAEVFECMRILEIAFHAFRLVARANIRVMHAALHAQFASYASLRKDNNCGQTKIVSRSQATLVLT
jgi:hypothetical protein